MSFSFGSLLAGFTFGVAGVFFIKAAKREANLRLLFLGITLLIFPYFVSNAYFCWALGIALTVIGYKNLNA
jgi:hypothetical protein